MREMAAVLDQAFLKAQDVVRLTEKHPDLSIDAAYRIQDELLAFRFERGEKQCGLKMGLTSKAKMKQMGVDSPIYGVLTDRMQVESGSRFSLKGSIHARIEPEIAFLISREIRGARSHADLLDS